MRRKRSSTHASAEQPRPKRRVAERATGSTRKKLPEATVCPECKASYHEGRWTWQSAPRGASEQICPACERISSRYPAGVLHVEGSFAAEHRDDLIGLVRNVEERERSKHPLKRVMRIEPTSKGFAVETTDAKLAQSLGRALHKAYAGKLEQPATTADKANLVRVRWVRD
jgi:NMD protein affecting ribosome stability and mRNA decay